MNDSSPSNTLAVLNPMLMPLKSAAMPGSSMSVEWLTTIAWGISTRKVSISWKTPAFHAASSVAGSSATPSSSASMAMGLP